MPVLGSGADASSLCTMILEAVLTLQDPEACLNPMAPAAQKVPDETPSPGEASHTPHLLVQLPDIPLREACQYHETVKLSVWSGDLFGLIAKGELSSRSHP